MLIVHCSSEWASRPLHSTSNGRLKTCGPVKSSLIEYLKSCGLSTGCYTAIDMLNGFWWVRFDIVCMVFSLLISEMIMRITQRRIQVQAFEGCTEYEKSTLEKNVLNSQDFTASSLHQLGGLFVSLWASLEVGRPCQILFVVVSSLAAFALWPHWALPDR